MLNIFILKLLGGFVLLLNGIFAVNSNPLFISIAGYSPLVEGYVSFS